MEEAMATRRTKGRKRGEEEKEEGEKSCNGTLLFINRNEFAAQAEI
jgi:hypothetical protein